MSVIVKGSGGGSKAEDLTVEKNEMDLLIQEIEESLVGKTTGATITPETVLDGYRGYKGKTLVEGKYKPHGQYLWNKYTAENGDFITRVADDSDDAYPDGGMKDGYWYESITNNVKVTIDGVQYIEELNLMSNRLSVSLGQLPFEFTQGSAVVFNGEIHILGSNRAYQAHHKWNGNAWVNVSTIPFGVANGDAVVFNGEIYLMCSGYMRSWNGSTWTTRSVPYNVSGGRLVVFNNELHLLGGTGAGTAHHKWNGSGWTSVSTLPFAFVDGSAVVYDGKIHILGSSNSSTYYKYHYVWNGSYWGSISTLPVDGRYADAVVFNDEIHLLGGGASPAKTHYKYDGTAWTSVGTLPQDMNYGSAVIHNGEINILGGTQIPTGHYMVDAEILKKVVA